MGESQPADRHRITLTFTILTALLMFGASLLFLFMALFLGKWRALTGIPFALTIGLGVIGLYLRRSGKQSALADKLPETIEGQRLDRQVPGWEVFWAFVLVGILSLVFWLTKYEF